jgi:hypothetical protein
METNETVESTETVEPQPKQKGRRAMVADTGGNKQLYAVLQVPTGSLTLGDHTIFALQVTPVPEAVRALACPEHTPVEFFSDEDAAKKAVKKLQDRIERKPATQS